MYEPHLDENGFFRTDAPPRTPLRIQIEEMRAQVAKLTKDCTKYFAGSEKYARTQKHIVQLNGQIIKAEQEDRHQRREDEERAADAEIRAAEEATPEQKARWTFLLDPKKCSVRKFLTGCPEVGWDGFRIDTKEAPAGGDNDVPWVLWPGQDRIVGMVDDHLLSVGLILHILKDREQGCSRVIQGIMYERFMRGGGGEGRTIAQDEKTTNNLLWDFKSHILQTPKYVWKMMGIAWEANAEGRWSIVWPGGSRRSKQETITAKTDALGRGSRLRFLHTSEYPHWQNGRGGLSNILTTANLSAGNVYFNESTGKGDDEFKYLCEAAKDGRSGHDFLFLSWLTHPKKRYVFFKQEEREDFVETIGKETRYDDKKERELVDDGATPEQLKWRRLQIDGSFFGNTGIFAREHPSRFDDAFMADSDCYFDLHLLRSWRKAAERAELGVKRGEIEVDDAKGASIRFTEKLGGPLRIYRMPEKGKSYVWGADPSAGRKRVEHGKREGDWAVVVVWECDSDDVAAIYRAHTPPEDLATVVMGLSKFYGWAPGFPEANNDGRVLLLKLDELEDSWGPPDTVVLHQLREHKTRSGFVTEDLAGFLSDQKSKPIAANRLRAWLRKIGEGTADGPSRIPLPLLREMLKYDQIQPKKDSPNSRPSLGSSDGFDDVVTAAMLGREAIQWATEHPQERRPYAGYPIELLSPRQIHEARLREQARVKREPLVLYHPFGESPVEIQRKKNHAIDTELGAMF